MDQAVARIHRMTQVKETYIHTVVIKDTIEESLMDNILDKKVDILRLCNLNILIFINVRTERPIPKNCGVRQCR